VINPVNVVPGSSGMPFTVTVSSTTAQTYAFSVNALGTDPAAIAALRLADVYCIAAPDF
jgi:hypothetical protein